MKYSLDLLPKEYKSFPRDTIGMVIAIIAIVTCVSAIGTMYYKNKSEVAAAQAKVDKVGSDLRSLIDRTGKLQPPVNEINALKNSINFINKNLDTPGSSWVDFLALIESSTPDTVVIKDINPKNFTSLVSKFVINGEALSVYDVLEFVNRLKNTGKFSVFLKQNSTVNTGDSSVQNFTIEFKYSNKKK